MCMISVVMEGYHPWGEGRNMDPFKVQSWINGVSREEFDKLKQEVEELKTVLQAAIEFDQKTNQPECQDEDKVALLKKVADALDVDLSELSL